MNLVSARCAEDFDDFNQLIHTRISWKERLAEDELCHDAADRPDIDWLSVVGRAKDELRGSVISGADVADIDLFFLQSLGRSKIANF